MRSGAAARHLLTSSKGPDVTARMLGRSRISSIARRTSSSVRGARSGERHDFTRSAVNGSLGSRPGKTISWSLVHTAGGGVPYILSVCACRCMSIIGGGIVCACRGTETERRTTPERFLIVCTPQRAIRRPNAAAKLLHANACRASLVPHYTTRRRRRRVRIGGGRQRRRRERSRRWRRFTVVRRGPPAQRQLQPVIRQQIAMSAVRRPTDSPHGGVPPDAHRSPLPLRSDRTWTRADCLAHTHDTPGPQLRARADAR